MENSKYIVGIDLGTTNCVVSYIDTQVDDEYEVPKTEILKITQVTDAGVVEELEHLPSFLYLPAKNELPVRSIDLPFKKDIDYVTGTFAGTRGSQVPTRLVSSAKSWLCNSSVDRTSPILPWKAPDGVRQLSPLAVSSLYLEHIKDSWNFTMAKGKDELLFQNQDVYLTVPASFDAVARELTVKAANLAGLQNVTLLEEPQAAFYAWLNGLGDEWRKNVKIGDVILVCDIGGGTTDLSLIKVIDEDGDLVLKRIAVGEHILLGGDNMDLTMAYEAQKKFLKDNIKLDSYQMLSLIHNCRQAKEKMLNDPKAKSHAVIIPGRGRKVVAKTLQKELTRAEVESVILDGFFPKTELDDDPNVIRKSGLKELGLKYAADTAVTKYVSKFLRQHKEVLGDQATGKTFIHPTKILFNGGVLKADTLKKRMMEIVNHWLKNDDGKNVGLLTGTHPDKAVSIGAAYYGMARRGKGIRVRAGAGRSYYIGVETSMPSVPGMPTPLKAICVVPFGMEEGTDTEIPEHEFGLVVGHPSVFCFLSSTVRKDDKPGAVIDSWTEGEIEELAPLETTLSAEGIEEELVPVKLHSYLTEIGTLELWCVTIDGSKKWKLEFNVREEQ